ncbi:MAG: diguanylate cyclase [Oscillospiraceae bacterium]|nr:diguanylate cyclase [Oscillospiraceae bacterium]
MKLKGFGITGRMVIIVLIPVIVLALFMSVFIGYSGYRNIYDEVSHELSSVCVSVFELLEHSENYQSARYEYFNENEDIFDNITERTDIYITVFEGDERRITTIKNADSSRAVGTRAAAEVVETVINGGNEFSSDNVDVNGSEFFGFYMPIKDDSGKVTGMVFAGKSRRTVLANVTRSVLGALAVSWFVALAAAVLSIPVSRGMARSLISAAEFLKKISLGDTDCEVNKRLVTRSDEIGDMGRSAVKLQKALKDLISNDPLTGLYNRRACNIKMDDLRAKSEHSGVPFAVAIGDIDFFKRFNDNYGHACGDIVLKDVARLLNDGMGDKGFVSRWGGEEFLLVFGGVPYGECVETLYEIVESIRGYRCEYDGLKIAVTMSFGISEYTGGTTDSLVNSADDKLYYGKNHGRDCIIERIPEECGEVSG